MSTLTYGAHDDPGDGLCLMEAVALLGGEAHTGSPACACPVLAAQAARDAFIRAIEVTS